MLLYRNIKQMFSLCLVNSFEEFRREESGNEENTSSEKKAPEQDDFRKIYLEEELSIIRNEERLERENYRPEFPLESQDPWNDGYGNDISPYSEKPIDIIGDAPRKKFKPSTEKELDDFAEQIKNEYEEWKKDLD